MRDDVFDNRCYDDLFRRVFEFEQYGGRKDIFWLELDYYITRDRFASRIGAALDVSMKSYSGNEIFRDAIDKEAIAAIAYKVIDEKIEPQTAFQDIYKVTEVYGYAPNGTFNTYSGEVVQFPTLRDTSADGKVEEAVTFTYDLGQIIFVDSGNLFNVGDSLDLSLDEKKNTNGTKVWFARGLQLSQVAEVRIANGVRTCYCTDIGWLFPLNDNLTSGTGGKVITDNGGSRTGKAMRGFVVREQFNSQATITNFVSYHTSFPNVDDKLRILAGNNEVQEINSATNPTYAQWQAWKTDGTLVCLLEPEITQVGALYKKTVKKCRAR